MNTKLCLKHPLTAICLCATLFMIMAMLACTQNRTKPLSPPKHPQTFVSILGIAQDAGYPQAGCLKDCCQAVYKDRSKARRAVCLGIVDQIGKTSWMIEASPEFPSQYHDLQQLAPQNQFGGIWLTHAHIGHYSGLMHLGREVMGAKRVPVYTMPRMKQFLDTNGPWSQLVKLQNIDLQRIKADTSYILNSQIAIEPILVPHRGEFSETVGYIVRGPAKSLLFIPDIDKWSHWERDIRDYIHQVDYALLDATFFQNGEIPGRDMSEIPHPFVEESLVLFADLPAKDKAKIHFLHFNHTNPLLQAGSAERQIVFDAGMNISEEGMVLAL
ncbi:MAG: MBL fold metallo-hydrolase [Bacteroidota bacterium]